MSLLALDAGATGVVARVITGSRVDAAASATYAEGPPSPPGWVDLAPDAVWRAVTGAVRSALAALRGPGAPDPGTLTQLRLTTADDAAVLWDRETLGSPRPALGPGDTRAEELCARLRADGRADRVAELAGLPLTTAATGPRLAWLAEHEPRTWALVEEGSYAVGGLESYLVARASRGTWHVTDTAHAGATLLLDHASGAWSPELCTLFGVPPDALPELVPREATGATTDPRSFAGLELAVILGD